MKVKTLNTINYLTPLENSFSNNYLSVRKKENRILSDNEVVNLPKININNPNYLEWKAREFSSNKVLNYLSKKQKPIKILDLGCGNGWFSDKISKIKNTTVTAIDVNIIELEQANKLFQKSNLEFVYGDIFKIDSFENQLDCIILNGCIQYFSDLNLLY